MITQREITAIASAVSKALREEKTSFDIEVGADTLELFGVKDEDYVVFRFTDLGNGRYRVRKISRSKD